MPPLLPLALFIFVLSALAAPVHAGQNLVRNGGFEEGPAGWTLPRTFRTVNDLAHSGQHSLKLENTDPKAYLLASQAVPFKPGMQYRYGAWIRTRAVQGNGSGATLCIEWSGPKGWLGGSYADGKKGSQDWFHVEATTPPIPKDATTLTVKLYLRPGMTGTAWFDEVTVTEFYPPTLDGALLKPNYRGRLSASNPDQQVLVRAKIGRPLPGGLLPEQATLVASIEQQGRTLTEQKAQGSSQTYTDLALDARPLAAGDYTVTLQLLTSGGVSLGRKEFQLAKLPAVSPDPPVFIDALNRTIVNGKPFFPLGWYFGPGPTDPDYAKHLDRLAASPFNTIMCYGSSAGDFARVRAYLDALEARRLKIIYSIKDVYQDTKHYREPVLGLRGEKTIVRGIVNAFKNHPALLGWYLNDELPLGMRERLDARQRLVRALDPGHPTWAVLFQVDEFFGYINSADVLGADPYPVDHKPVTQAAEWTRKCAAVSGGRLPLWMVPQAFDWANYPAVQRGRHRPPTLGEELVMTYLCLINGAHGLVYYSYMDMQRDKNDGFEKRWADMLVVGNEVRQLFPALLSTAPPPRLELKPDDPALETAVRADDAGNAYVLVANPGEKPATVQIAVPRGARLELLRNARKESAAARDGQCAVRLEPMSAATLIVNK